MRATAATKMNEASSRSHALLQLSVSWEEKKGKSFAQLNLVDLAGSEGMKKTGAQGAAAKEGIKINLSLGKLALTVKCLAEGASHIPYRESKLTMMLSKGLGGNNMLHIILALSNSAEQVNEGTACLRFGQSCLRMSVNPNANKMEKEQAEMKVVIQEQLKDISDLKSENEALKQRLEDERKRQAEVPDFMIAKHIEVNKEALNDDLREAAEQIDELKQALEAKRLEKLALESGEVTEEIDEAAFAGMNAQQKAEAIEAKQREMMVARMKVSAETDQEMKQLESELAQMLEIEGNIQGKLAKADEANAVDEERIRQEVEETLAEERALVESKAAELEAQMQAALESGTSSKKEAAAAKKLADQQAAELSAMRDQIAKMAEAQEDAAADGSEKIRTRLADGSLFDPSATMIKKAELKMARKARSKKADPDAVKRVLDTLPVLAACNDLRSLTELEPGNRGLFQSMGGVNKLVDYLSPYGPQAPYATHVARTIPCVMDADGRKKFYEAASQPDSSGEVRFKYLSTLLDSHDPDDKEHACLAIASVTQDCEPNRVAFFKHGISVTVFAVLQDTCRQEMPRQRLQRVVVMALAELANNYAPFKDKMCEAEGIPMMLAMLTPSNDPFVIKETLQLMGRLTQNHAGVQSELQRYNAIQVYSQLLFAQMHDAAITELAALALVNLVSEVPAALSSIEQHPRYNKIRYELLASMARALSASMLRNNELTMGLGGSHDFHFWGSAAVGNWEDGNAGGDRTHTSFSDNPQYLLRAPPGTNLTILLQDTLEDARSRERGKSRPLFLRLCVTAATPEAMKSRLKLLDIAGSGAKPATSDQDGVVCLQPNVNAFLDVAKTREVAMHCHVKACGPEQCWVIIPHVGCSHQHSRFVLSVFADREVSLEGELQPWHKRTICSSWTQLCSAPNAINDALWRNCPQFQLINVDEKPSTAVAFLSYGERDETRNKRHTLTVDPPGGVGVEDKPLLSMYVMKSRVPDKRFVGTLSPQV